MSDENVLEDQIRKIEGWLDSWSEFKGGDLDEEDDFKVATRVKELKVTNEDMWRVWKLRKIRKDRLVNK